MQNQIELYKITRFLAYVGPFLIESLYNSLTSAGYEVNVTGQALETCLKIKAGNKSVDFILHNLFLEIATKDRDEEQLRFDDKLHAFSYFWDKTKRLINSKLAILLPLLKKDNLEAAIEHVISLSDRYERINIWRLDPENSAENF
jgi:hypothetical protein